MKKQQTHAKQARELELKERRERKRKRKAQAASQRAAEGDATPGNDDDAVSAPGTHDHATGTSGGEPAR